MQKGLKGLLYRLDSRDWFQKELDNIFNSKKRPPKAIDYFYASWAGECPKWIQYNMKGMITDGVDAQGQRRMDNGNYMHSRYGDYFKDAGKLQGQEPAFRKDLDGVFVSGRGDIIVLDDNGEKCLIEMKSINDRGFKLILKEANEGDVLQWNLCSKALEIINGIIFYENKNTQEIKYHFVTFDQERLDLVLNDFKEVDKYNKLGQLIPRPDICKNSRYCGARGFCE